MRSSHRRARRITPIGAAALVLLLASCATDDEPSADGEVVEDLTGEPADDGDGDGDEDGDDVGDGEVADEPLATDPDGGADGADDGDDDGASDDGTEDDPGEGADADGDQDPDTGDAPIDPATGDLDGADVDAVLGDLLAAQSEVLRDVVGREAGEVLTDEDEDRLDDVLSGPRLEEVRGTYLRYAQLASAREPLLDPEDLGDLGWETAEVVEVDDTCVLAIGSYDLTETSQEPYPDDLAVLVSLRFGDDDGGGASDRSTGWRVHDLATLVSDGEPIQEGDWDRIEYGRVVERTCEA